MEALSWPNASPPTCHHRQLRPPTAHPASETEVTQQPWLPTENSGSSGSFIPQADVAVEELIGI